MNLDTIPWTLVEAAHEGGYIFFRYREFPNDFPKEEFAHRLNLFWQMSEPDSNGLAETAEAERLEVFENRFVEATEHDAQSVLALVITGKGQREFVVQTRDPSEFLRRLTAMPQEAERYPLEIHHNEDPDWDYFNCVLGDMNLD